MRCEHDSIGFEELSFMEFPPLDPRSNLISVEVATVQQNCLLLYNTGGASYQDFIALELVEGRVCLSFDLGAGPVRLETGKRVADGLFHSITVKRIGNVSFTHKHLNRSACQHTLDTDAYKHTNKHIFIAQQHILLRGE